MAASSGSSPGAVRRGKEVMSRASGGTRRISCLTESRMRRRMLLNHSSNRCRVSGEEPGFSRRGVGRRRSEAEEALAPTERKRPAELRIKKRVKLLYLSGKFYDLMGKVVTNADTLEDAYDIVRLNSNVDLASARDDFCSVALAEQLRSREFDVRANAFSVAAKRRGGASMVVLPRLNLKVIREVVRVVLQVVYRPKFSKISHGCRSGRGYHSALKFISKEIGIPDWCFTAPMYKEVDSNVVSKRISLIQEKFESPVSYIHARCV